MSKPTVASNVLCEKDSVDTYEYTDETMLKNTLTEASSLPQEVVIMESKEISEQNHKVQSVMLLRYCSNVPSNKNNMGYDKVFTPKHEVQLIRYCQHAVRLNYGFTPKEFRKFSFEYAVANNINCPPKWHKNKSASSDWFDEFVTRNKKLSNQNESTLLLPNLKTDQTNIQKFYNYLENLLNENEFKPQNIYNVDETGLSEHFQQYANPINYPRHIGRSKQNKTVSMCLAVNAVGKTIPPLFVQPNNKILEEIEINTSNINKSGWLQEIEFLQFIKHFAKYAKAGPDNKVLLMLDNQNEQIQLPVIEFCKMKYITMLSFPPNSSEKLQPLDQKVFGPFQKLYEKGCDSWFQDNPGKRMHITDLQKIAEVALPQAATPGNIMEGFSCTGIHPFNSNIFNELKQSAVETQSINSIDILVHAEEEIDIMNFEPLGEDIPNKFQKIKSPNKALRRSTRLKMKHPMEIFNERGEKRVLKPKGCNDKNIKKIKV